MKSCYVFVFIFLFCLAACADKQPDEKKTKNNITDTTTVIKTPGKDSFTSGKIIDNIVCRNNPAQSYALYIPSTFRSKPLPVIYFFDPHAAGTLPLKKYKILADKYGYILIGSNNSKNGNTWQTTENIWNALFNDTQNRLTFNNNRIYTSGFSGGAKVAGYIALHHNEIKGVIANGAGLPDETPAGNFNFSFTAIAGKGDMNMTDLITFNNELNKTQTRHRIILFDGKHAWTPINIMNIAFEGLEFDAMHDKLIAKNDSLLNVYFENSRKMLNNDLNANNLIQADEECRLSINMLNGLTQEINWFKEKDISITGNVLYRQQLQAEQNLFTIEQNKKAEYQQQFQQGNMQYWTETLNTLQTKAKVNGE